MCAVCINYNACSIFTMRQNNLIRILIPKTVVYHFEAGLQRICSDALEPASDWTPPVGLKHAALARLPSD